MVILALAAAAVMFLAAFPLPMRVDGNALVAPLHRAQVQPEVEGIVGRIYVHEGEHMNRGQVLAEMKLDSGATRNAAACAISSGSPTRPTMERSAIDWISFRLVGASCSPVAETGD